MVLIVGVMTVTVANAQRAGYWHTADAQTYAANHYKSILTIQAEGYNAVRIPLSNHAVEMSSAFFVNGAACH
jgi:hypothetical protein